MRIIEYLATAAMMAAATFYMADTTAKSISASLEHSAEIVRSSAHLGGR